MEGMSSLPGIMRIEMDAGAGFVRRLSEEDRGAQAEIIDMIDFEGWNIRDVRVSEWEEGRSLLLAVADAAPAH